jgi:hypothetical protein
MKRVVPMLRNYVNDIDCNILRDVDSFKIQFDHETECLTFYGRIGNNFSTWKFTVDFMANKCHRKKEWMHNNEFRHRDYGWYEMNKNDIAKVIAIVNFFIADQLKKLDGRAYNFKNLKKVFPSDDRYWVTLDWLRKI